MNTITRSPSDATDRLARRVLIDALRARSERDRARWLLAQALGMDRRGLRVLRDAAAVSERDLREAERG